MKRLARSDSMNDAALRVQTLGGFRVWREGKEIASVAWGREKAQHLFQFFVTLRRRAMHKEEIMDRLWPELDKELGDRDFRVALNAVNKVLEPQRASRETPRFIKRFDLAYMLNLEEMWIDADEFEARIEQGNRQLSTDPAQAVEHYRAAVALYRGDYLPERHYEDWSSVERERLLTLAHVTMTTLANLLCESDPRESLRLTQAVLARDGAWEDAYRIQMRAYMTLGNRAQALRAYQHCVKTLHDEFGVEPLPETQKLFEEIKRI